MRVRKRVRVRGRVRVRKRVRVRGRVRVRACIVISNLCCLFTHGYSCWGIIVKAKE